MPPGRPRRSRPGCSRRTDIGSLETGRRADFVVLDADLRVAGVVVGGAAVSA